MVQEDYCSYEVAKLLKEKGFDWECEHVIWDGADDNYENYDKAIPDPSHQMAMKWLREVHKLSIEPYSIAIEENCIGYAYSICSCETGLEMFAERWDGKNPFVSYEEAVEAALKYSLENLI